MNMYDLAKQEYKAIGIDTDAAIECLRDIPVSIHCWQGDDVIGLDGGGALSGGIQTTGNYPGRALGISTLRLFRLFSLAPRILIYCFSLFCIVISLFPPLFLLILSQEWIMRKHLFVSSQQEI